MSSMPKILLLFLLLLSPGFTVLAQQSAPQGQPGQASTRGQSAAERAQQQQEELLKKELRKYPELDKLSSAQKKHLQVYLQVMKMTLQHKYDPEKVFEPLFNPVGLFATEMLPVYLNATEKAEARRDELLQKGQQKLAAKISNRAQNYRALAKVCQDMITAYKEKRNGQMRTLMNQYRQIEASLEIEGVKAPKREWLTSYEAEMLAIMITNRNKNRQK